MGFLLVCMGVQFIINGVLEIISTGIPDRPRCAEKARRRDTGGLLCDGIRSGAADGLPAIPASDGISSVTRPARPAPEWRRRSRRRPWKDADSRLPTSAPAPMPILKMPEKRHGDVGGIRSGGQHFHLHAETDNHDRHPQKMLSSIRCCGLCEAGSSSSRRAAGQSPLISPDACWLPSLPNRMLPIIPAPPGSAAVRWQSCRSGPLPSGQRARYSCRRYNERSPPPRSECTR